MKKKQKADEKELAWEPFMACPICHEPLERAVISPVEVSLRHVESKLSYESCRKDRR